MQIPDTLGNPNERDNNKFSNESCRGFFQTCLTTQVQDKEEQLQRLLDSWNYIVEAAT